MRSRLLAASAVLLLLPACQPAEPSSEASAPPSSTSTLESMSPSAVPERSARAVLAEAVGRLEREGRAAYAYRVMSDGVALLDARGSFDLGAKADHVALRLLVPDTLATGMWEDIWIGSDHYVKADWFPDSQDKCYVNLDDSALGLAAAALTDFHPDLLSLLHATRATGFDRSSDDFVEGTLPLAQLAGLVGSINLHARRALAESDATVAIQVVISDGRVERWEVTAADLERAVGGLPRTERQGLVLGDVSYVLIDGDTEEIVPPPSREVATDVDHPCAAGGAAA